MYIRIWSNHFRRQSCRSTALLSPCLLGTLSGPPVPLRTSMIKMLHAAYTLGLGRSSQRSELARTKKRASQEGPAARHSAECTYPAKQCVPGKQSASGALPAHLEGLGQKCAFRSAREPEHPPKVDSTPRSWTEGLAVGL